MSAGVSCHACGYDIDLGDVFSDPECFSCPKCGAGTNEM